MIKTRSCLEKLHDYTPGKSIEEVAEKHGLQKVVKLAFGQRRKMLRQSLKELHPEIQTILKLHGINPQSRPEELSIKQFCSLATAIKK